MVAIRILLGAILGLFALLGTAQAEPRITEARDAAACRQALVVAKLAFESAAPNLADAAPLIIKEKHPAYGILLAPNGGHGDNDDFIVDDTAIEVKAPAGNLKALMLVRAEADGVRFAVTRQRMNWQGDWYGLYVADSALDADKVAELLAPEKVTGAKVVFDRAWQRPWIVRDPDSQQIVGIDTQQPADFLADWIVYKATGGEVTPACRIAFRPPAEESLVLVPAGALRELLEVLDYMVGKPSQNEGTLQPTARIRLAAIQAWANAALRPWAVAEPYNSPAEIERGLKARAHTNRDFRTLHFRMQMLYPRAFAALTTHYRVTLNKSLAEAATLAKAVLERAVGAHFVFPKGT